MTESPYDKLGGREAVLTLSDRFYDIMDADEPALARLHVLDESGRVSRRSRDRFAQFLLGWLGGPDDYVKENGHPRLRMRHAHVPVDRAQRDAWLRCMNRAMDDCDIDASVKEFLKVRFFDVADFMRNVEEGTP